MADQTDIVEQVKAKNLIEDVIEADGFPLPKRGGRWRKCTAPNTGGLVVDTHGQCYFWNTKGEHGDIINWVMERHGLDFKNAIEWLADRAALPRPEWGKADPAQRVAARMKEDALEVAQRVFVRWFWKNAEVQAYATRRGWTTWLGKDEEGNDIPGTIPLARLGYSGDGSNDEYAEMRRELQAAGVDLDSPVAISILGMKGDVAGWAKKHDIEIGDDYLLKGYIPGMMGHKRLVYPHLRFGRVVYMAGRGTDVKFHFNLVRDLVGSRQPYFNHIYAPKADECVIVEGQADAASLAQWGIACVALAGVAPGDDLAQQLNGHKTLYVGLDADKTGKASSWTVADALGPLTRIVNWRQAKHTAKAKYGKGSKPIDSADDLVRALAEGRLEDEQPEVITATLNVLPKVKDADGFDRPGFTNAEGHPALVAGANQLWLAMGQVFTDANELREARRKLLLEFIEWAPVFASGAGEIEPVKDANDLLKAFSQAGMNQDAQEAHVRELMKQARTYVETICEWAGKQEGAAKDDAMTQALKVVARLDEMQMSYQRMILAKLLKTTQREMTAMLKALAVVEEREKSEGEPVYTWGGPVNGYLIEYLYDLEKNQASLAWRDPQGRINSGASVTIEGREYRPYPVNETLRNGTILFPSALGEKKSISELVSYIQLYIKSIYLLPSEQFGRLVAYWVLTTWLYDSFETVIYLRAMGGAGAGKSELCKRIGMICYRTMSASGASSPSSLFRTVERYKGTVYLDEADLAQSDEAQDMVKFYNTGAMRGGNILRTVEIKGPNGERDFEERGFQTYCPKLIAMRKDFKDDAVGSRSLTIKLVAREMAELKAAGIPLNVNGTIRARAQALRNALLRWRLEAWQPEIEVDWDFYEMTISPRLNQVAGPLLAIARDDPDQQADIRRTLREYYQETIINQSMTLEARVLEALWKIYQYPKMKAELVKVWADGQEVIRVGDITRVTNEVINEMNDDGKDAEEEDEKKFRGREMTAQRIGKILRGALGFQISDRKRDGYWLYWNEPKMIGLSTKYGIDRENFKPPEAGKLSPMAPGA